MNRRTMAAMVAAFSLIAQETNAILIRHDREDAKYLELGARFPCVGTIGRMGQGTLIGPRWVLTAAHVAQGAKRRLASPAVRFAGRDYAITEFIIHPDWVDGGPNDIALLRLAEPVDGIEPAKIYEATDEVGKEIIFVGNGGTGTGLTGPTREDGRMRGATNKAESADEHWLKFVFDERPGATDLEGISGPGDSGGPALLEKEGHLYVLGVSVWGSPGKNGRGTYGAGEGYTRVSSYRNWIGQTINGRTA